MSVSRSIKIRVLSNEDSISEFIEHFTEDFWHFKNEEGAYFSIPLHDEEDFDYQAFTDKKTVEHILDQREKQQEVNAIGLWDKGFEESFGMLIYPLENTYANANKHYLLSFTPDTAKRITGSDRLTDFGYYLNQLIPKLISMGCYICEVTCHDFDS